MAYTYGVIIENYKGQTFRIAAVTNNVVSRNDIPAIIASKGRGYSCIEIPYDMKTLLENGGHLVYTIDGVSGDYADDTRLTLPMHITGDVPTVDDFFIYKTNNSAIDRVKKLNAQYAENGERYEAISVDFNVNTIY